MQWARDKTTADAPALKLGLLMRASVLHRVKLPCSAANQHLAATDGHSATIVVRQFCLRKRRLEIRHYKVSQFGDARLMTSRERKMLAPHFLKKTIQLDYFWCPR
jgi:hypothetical protein